MPSKLVMFGAPLAIVIGTFFQLFVRPLLTNGFGVGRVMQPLSDFPAYKCRRIVHPLLEACEDLYLDEKDRKLYAACSTPEGRKAYQPTVNRRNVSASRPSTDHFTVLDIDNLGPKKDFNPERLTTKGYVGAQGTTELDLHGFDVEAMGDTTLRFYVVNHRPPVDKTTKEYVDAFEVGCNSTVEVFDLTRGATELQHVQTYSDPEVIKTPNRVAATGEGGFVATNDHKTKAAFSRAVEPITGGGSLAFCGKKKCNLATYDFLKQPNGLTRSAHDGLYYVPSSADGHVRAFRLDPPTATPRKLSMVADIDVGMPMDNLAVDANGAIWAAAFPKVLQLVDGFNNPREAHPPTAAIRIERRMNEDPTGKPWEYVVEKVIEDRDGEVLPGTTTVLHDAKTGRLFFGGVYSPFIAVCDKTNA